jgi:hypothetical protein
MGLIIKSVLKCVKPETYVHKIKEMPWGFPHFNTPITIGKKYLNKFKK